MTSELRRSETPTSHPKASNQLDRDLLALIEQRCRLVEQTLSESTVHFHESWREASSQIEQSETGAQDGEGNGEDSESGLLPSSVRQEILRHILSACYQAARPSSVAYLGPIDSYSHLAATAYFGEAANVQPVASIAAVFDAVSRGDCDCGIVPIENSTDGRVVDTLSRLASSDVRVVGEILVAIHHNLLATCDQDAIQEVHSKPQALSQCRQWLADHLPNARLIETTSTAAAAQTASQTPGVAAVASLQAGRRYDLNVIQPSIEDNRDNVTRFAVLGSVEPAATGDDKTTLIFQVDHQPGALADVMGIFKEHQLNLTWIESFPQPGCPNEYFFIVEFPGHQTDSTAAAAIGSLRKTHV